MSWWILGLWLASSVTGLVALLAAYRRPVYAPEDEGAAREARPAGPSANGSSRHESRRAVAA